MSRRSSLRTPKKSTVALSPSMATTLPGTPRHMASLLLSRAGREGRVRDHRLPERDPTVSRRDLAVLVYLERPPELAQDPLGEPCVLEAAAREHDRERPVGCGS